MNESVATTTILRKLKEHGHFWKSSDLFQAGVPDIIGCYEGGFLGIEMKVDYNKPSPLQIHTLCMIIKNRGYAGVVTYSNRTKSWWILGREYTLSDAVLHILEKSRRGHKDIEVKRSSKDGTTDGKKA